MDTWNSRRSNCRIFVHAVLVMFGLTGAAWATLVLPTLKSVALARDLERGMIVGDNFKLAALESALSRLPEDRPDVMERSVLVRTEAFVRLRIADLTMQHGSQEGAEHAAILATTSIRSSIVLDPCASFNWFMLYSININLDGFDQKYVKYLAESYLLGPREGWISVRRNRLALAAFSSLSEPLKEVVVLEFAAMVRSDLVEEAVINLTTVGWTYRERLLAGLEQVDLSDRKRFAIRLSEEGARAEVPGIVQYERPWR